MHDDQVDLGRPMDGIPPTREGDTEDVIWALETAESLWKRQARIDAIVWVRRAAQAAADAGDGERAASLTREAATLTEVVGHNSAPMRSVPPVSVPGGDVDELLEATEELDDGDLISVPPPTPVAGSDYPPAAHAAKHRPPPPPLKRHAPSTAPVHRDEPLAVDPRIPSDRPTAGPGPMDDEDIPAAARAPGELELSLPALSDTVPRELDSAPVLRDLTLPTPTPFPAPRAPEPSDAGVIPQVTPSDPVPALTEAAPESIPESAAEAATESIEALPEAVTAAAPEAVPAAVSEETPGITRMGSDALSPMDLANLEALANVSDDQREGLARAASVILCAAGVVVPSFAMALVLEGEVTISNASGTRMIARQKEGTLIHARGTLEDTVGLRVTVASDDTTLAVWSAETLTEVLSTSPWVEEDLCAEGDRLQAWAQVADSALAARLHEDVRLRLFSKLKVKTLSAGDDLIAEGEPVPGIFLVGAGAITVASAPPTDLRSGEFVFPEATLGAARASSSARAGTAGAVVLTGDRKTTQELCSTEPLLLEILAGM